MSAIHLPLLFAATFLLVFLLGLQSKNVANSRYFAAVMTSLGISVANFTFVKFAATGGMSEFIWSAAGGCLGIAASIWFYDHVLTRKKTPGTSALDQLRMAAPPIPPIPPKVPERPDALTWPQINARLRRRRIIFAAAEQMSRQQVKNWSAP